MQIVIDMPEGIFESVKRYYEQNQEDCYALCAYVANGTPLPKGHGRLIDANVLVDGMEDDYEFCEAVNATPTIIPAAESVEKQ